MVRPVGIHFHQCPVAGGKPPFEAREVGAPESGFFRTVLNMNLGVEGGQLVRYLAGSVGRVVIDDEHVGMG